ncbi:MAG: PorV/PorQ family protein [Bacteroidia bacterium]
MKYYHSIILFASLWAGMSITVQGQSNKPEVRKYANEFLKIGVSARAMGMGNSQVAISDDVTAGYWNPAGLVNVESPEISLMHAAYFANVANYNHVGFALPLDSAKTRTFAVNLIRFGVDNIPNTLNLVNNQQINFDNVRDFSVADFAALMSYAWKIRAVEGLSVGTNFKIIYRGIGKFGNGWGFGLDAAARYQRKGFMAGIMVADATNTMTAFTFNTETFQDAFINTGNAVPQNSIELMRPSLNIGLGQKVNIGNTMRAVFALDGNFSFDGARSAALISGGKMTLDPRLGVELSYLKDNKPMISLRGGMYNFQKEPDIEKGTVVTMFPTAGVGFGLKRFQIDYALSNVGGFSQARYSHIISAKFFLK